jgi:hypothetical protein
MANNQNKKFNLDIKTYSLKEVLDIFGIEMKDISDDDVKRAKRIFLSKHPDKSGLDSSYFLFYKKAFDIVQEFNTESKKIRTKTPNKPIKYTPENVSDLNDASNDVIAQNIKALSAEDFNKKFNKLFTNEIVSKDEEHVNDWFTSEEDNPYNSRLPPATMKNLGENFERLRDMNSGMIKYNNKLKDMQSAGGMHLGSFHDADINDKSQYLSSNVFSKLQYDDLRKVHKDETIFSVGEKDFDKTKKYATSDEYLNDANNYQHICKADNELLLKLEAEKFHKRMMEKEHVSRTNVKENEGKNKTFLSSFLRLMNV